jgi:hypothetical protein
MGAGVSWRGRGQQQSSELEAVAGELQGGRRRARRREAALACLFALAATAILLYPVSLHPATFSRADSADGRFNIWNVAWVARTLVVDPAHVLDANIFFPHQNTLAYSELNLGAGVLAIPGYWLTRNPYVAYNSAVLLMFVLTILATWWLVRDLTGSASAGAVAGVCFAFCPYIFSQTAEIQLMMIAGFPATMLAFHRLADRPSLGRAVLLGLAIAATGLFCAYYGTFAGLMVGWAAIVIATTRRLWTSPRYWSALTLAAVVALLGVLPFFWPYLRLENVHGFGRSFDDTMQYSANWQSYLASGARADRWLLERVHGWVDVLFPGLVAIGLALVGIAAAAWARLGMRRGVSTPHRRGETAFLYGSITVLAGWLSFGPRAGLYMIPYKLLPPVFALLRAPSRFGVLVTFGLAILAGTGAAALQRRARRSTWLMVALCAVAMADVSVSVPRTPVLPIPEAYRTLETLPPGPVLELPLYWQPQDRPRNSLYMLYSTTGWRPIVGGYSDYLPPEYRELGQVLSDFPTPKSLQMMQSLHVRYVMFHPELYGSKARRASLRRRLARYARVLHPIRIDADAWLYAMENTPPARRPVRVTVTPADAAR